MVDIAKAMLNPAAVFRSPGDVVQCIDLSWEQQIDILCRWAYEARDMNIAAYDNLLAPPLSYLEQILQALHTLNAQRAGERVAITKPGEKRKLRRQARARAAS